MEFHVCLPVSEGAQSLHVKVRLPLWQAIKNLPDRADSETLSIPIAHLTVCSIVEAESGISLQLKLNDLLLAGS